ncbi:hypothetical protein [Microbispora triticiradicis]|uniref:hypothetical protein n=1 Tax=Microbispora triticiradicis TaxID=2200763 RepID=UPI001AD70A99|nr:hypothetical protein [Microbispora triticiradicis]MBO4272375.1 hypothetical protein [Microbispora triticiradicis]
MSYKTFESGQLFTTSDLDAVLMSQVIIRCTSTTRPPSPEEGWHIYETDTLLLKIYKSGQWADDIGANQDLVSRMPTDHTRDNTLDGTASGLGVTVEANSKYLLEVLLFATCPNSGTFLDYDFVIPANANVYLVTNHPASGEEGPVNKQARQTGAIAMASWVQPNGSAVQVRGLLQTGANGGAFQVNFRNNVAGNAITLKAGTTIRLRKVI